MARRRVAGKQELEKLIAGAIKEWAQQFRYEAGITDLYDLTGSYGECLAQTITARLEVHLPLVPRRATGPPKLAAILQCLLPGPLVAKKAVRWEKYRSGSGSWIHALTSRTRNRLAERGQSENQCAPIRGEQSPFLVPLPKGNLAEEWPPFQKEAAPRRENYSRPRFLLCHRCAFLARWLASHYRPVAE